MIRIQHPDLERIAETHALAIEQYVIGKNRFKEVQKEIKCFLPEFDLGVVLRTGPDDLRELSLKWRKGIAKYELGLADLSTIKKKKKKELNSDTERSLHSICKYFDTLYSYLTNTGKKKPPYIFGGNQSYNSRIMLKLLEITVCPYCNRNYIYNAGSRRTSELDHFYSKSKYPFLALSFYNLIPSCSICNRFKGVRSLCVNPYQAESAFDKVKFQLEITGAGPNYQKNDFKILLYGDQLSREERIALERHKIVLKLRELYDGHKDIVLELIQKHITYSDSYIDELFHLHKGTLFNNRNDVLRHVYGNYVDPADDHKRPLAKLVRDITEDLEE